MDFIFSNFKLQIVAFNSLLHLQFWDPLVVPIAGSRTVERYTWYLTAIQLLFVDEERAVYIILQSSFFLVFASLLDLRYSNHSPFQLNKSSLSKRENKFSKLDCTTIIVALNSLPHLQFWDTSCQWVPISVLVRWKDTYQQFNFIS